MHTLIRFTAFTILAMAGIRLEWILDDIGFALYELLDPNWMGGLDARQPGAYDWRTAAAYVLEILFPFVVSSTTIAIPLIRQRAPRVVVGFTSALVPLCGYHIRYTLEMLDIMGPVDAQRVAEQFIIALTAIAPALLLSRYRRPSDIHGTPDANPVGPMNPAARSIPSSPEN